MRAVAVSLHQYIWCFSVSNPPPQNETCRNVTFLFPLFADLGRARVKLLKSTEALADYRLEAAAYSSEYFCAPTFLFSVCLIVDLTFKKNTDARIDVSSTFQSVEADKSSLHTLLATDSSTTLHDDIECRNGAGNGLMKLPTNICQNPALLLCEVSFPKLEFGRLLTTWREKSENQEDERRFGEDIERLEDFTRCPLKDMIMR